MTRGEPCRRNCKDYAQHYTQSGSGLPVFKGSFVQNGYGQTGYGLGNLIAGLFRSAIPILSITIVPAIKKAVVPILKRTAKNVGSTLFKSGMYYLMYYYK